PRVQRFFKAKRNSKDTISSNVWASVIFVQLDSKLSLPTLPHNFFSSTFAAHFQQQQIEFMKQYFFNGWFFSFYGLP
ncbi:MAG: hypothetical protein AAB316_04500, partial [Bacteroidota bacterium]